MAQITAPELVTQALQHVAWLVSKRLITGRVNLLVGEVAVVYVRRADRLEPWGQRTG